MTPATRAALVEVTVVRCAITMPRYDFADKIKTYALHGMSRDAWNYRWNSHALAAPGYYAGMGFGVPAGIGVAATGLRPLVLVGDGAFQMNVQELATCAQYGIPVYDIRPGIIKTDMTAGVQAKYDALISEGLLLQPRWGQPGDVGKAVAMLARGDLAYSTGQVLYIDGGFMVRRL